MSKYYNNLIYDNEKNLFSTLQHTYPSLFDEYLQYFTDINY
jgi:hypothetical protein